MLDKTRHRQAHVGVNYEVYDSDPYTACPPEPESILLSPGFSPTTWPYAWLALLDPGCTTIGCPGGCSRSGLTSGLLKSSWNNKTWRMSGDRQRVFFPIYVEYLMDAHLNLKHPEVKLWQNYHISSHRKTWPVRTKPASCSIKHENFQAQLVLFHR